MAAGVAGVARRPSRFTALVRFNPTPTRRAWAAGSREDPLEGLRAMAVSGAPGLELAALSAQCIQEGAERLDD
eukprot:5996099-Alexandrium_andersonii.AAC.1